MNKKPEKSIVVMILLILGILFFGIGVAALMALLHGATMGFYLWPLVLCSDVFAFCTIGFFCTEQKTEKIYMLCSAISFLLMIVQAIVLF